MEAAILIGLPGAGKSSFFKQRFFDTHVRMSLDLLRTRYRERCLLDFCLATEQKFVIDNTNPTKAERQTYIEAAKSKRFRIIGYYFESKVEDCLRRNAQRPDGQRVPDVAILAKAKEFELPALDEGFDELFHVRLSDGGFVVSEWQDELR